MFVVLAALGQLGIQTTSLNAIIGAAGLALQWSLSNFAAGFLVIIFRPFKVGDFIEGAGVAGTVEAIHIPQGDVHVYEHNKQYRPLNYALEIFIDR